LLTLAVALAVAVETGAPSSFRAGCFGVIVLS
jgi:hypothetical protein